MKITQFTFYVMMSVTLMSTSCGIFRRPDPLAGWQMELDKEPDSVIVKDYQDYIEKLPYQEKKFVQGGIWFFKNATGQHAIRIEIPVNGTWREHVLIYDEDNKRIRTIKYAGGKYAS